MTTRTDPENLRIPTIRDFVDAQGARDLAVDVDAAAHSLNVEFTGIRDPAAFLLRAPAVSTFTNGVGNTPTFNVDYDTTGGPTPATGAISWFQSSSDVESWWVVGFNCSTANTAGTPLTTERIAAWIEVDYYSPQSSNLLTYAYAGYKLTFETNTGGEALSVVTVIRAYRAIVRPFIGAFGPDTATRTIPAGARFWGFRLGDA